jgi:hypothetical protein
MGGSGGLGTMLNPNQGYIQFPNQGAAPTFTGSQPGLYGYTPLLTGVEELYVAKNIIGPAFSQIPMTASSLSNLAPVLAQAGWTYLPSGILIKWNGGGPYATGLNQAVTIPSSASVPAFNNLFLVIVQGGTVPGNQVLLNALTNANQFAVNVFNGPLAFNYLAIGN